MGCGSSTQTAVLARNSPDAPLPTPTGEAATPPWLIEAHEKSPAEAEAACEAVPEVGVAVWWLRRFADEHAARLSGHSTGGSGVPLSTAAVSGWLKATATFDRKCAFVDLPEMRQLVDADGRPAVGHATVFASHAWNNPFLDFVEAMEAKLGAGSGIFVWNGAVPTTPQPSGGERNSHADLHNALVLDCRD